MDKPKNTIRPVEHRSYAKLTGVRIYPNNYLWLDIHADNGCYPTDHVEITFMNGRFIIHASAEFIQSIELVPYDENGNAPGMRDVEVMS